MARNYFGCSDLPYVPLENNGGRGSVRYVVHTCIIYYIIKSYSGGTSQAYM